MKYPVMQGDEHLTNLSRELSQTAKDFWAWAMSRLLADGPRGDLAEFIVNTALGCDTTDAKRGWGECDIIYRGARIEVKCSSMLQARDRETPPKPVFSISKTTNCDIEETETGYRYCGRDGKSPERRSEIYILCLFANTDRSTANPLAMEQWQFFILKTSEINRRCGNSRTLSLAKLRRWNVRTYTFDEIKPTVDSIIASPTD